MSSLTDALRSAAVSKKPTKTVSFNKFFPKDNAFVNVDGGFKDVEDWWVDFTIQTGTRDAINFWTSDYKPEESIKQLKAMIEGANKTIDFIETCMKMKPAKMTVKKTTPKKK